ncbi:thiol reductase thioredoxin [Bacillus cereus]|uniref:thioredoxin family protein n=1 Tax=Bacillus cereus TaxID=1396 RepID=UPI000BFA34C2|nr:thioredoxin family protein [Bacillus cereus]PFL19666.1 thiol reductase thioredoxin [Bacillus cereus]PFR59656.1 thiol reductase thioredoxin [Bacillus cereus]PGW91998.1 thiol reductase thioredoxin [Bacillus cereus]PGY90700.1 thiol reductase thioredoxin [Bacillus cereus]PGZ22879.1 thiol reductase thioredoxin [Bacillus cereus]
MKKIIILSFITITTLIFIFIFTNKKEKITITTNNMQNEIKVNELQNNLLKKDEKFVYFYQTNCSYCKKVSPIIIPMAKELDIDMKTLNLEKEPNGWNLFNIEGTPTIIHYKNGKEIDRIEGEYKEEEFKIWFQKNTNKNIKSI